MAYGKAGAKSLVTRVARMRGHKPRETLALGSDSQEPLKPAEQSPEFSIEFQPPMTTTSDAVETQYKLEIGTILRSFLVLASERDSNGLVRQVLEILMRVSCIDCRRGLLMNR